MPSTAAQPPAAPPASAGNVVGATVGYGSTDPAHPVVLELVIETADGQADVIHAQLTGPLALALSIQLGHNSRLPQLTQRTHR